MGSKAASTKRSTATSTVSSQAVIIYSGNATPAGSGTPFGIAGSAIAANSVISLNIVIPGQNSASSTTTVSGSGNIPTIANIQYLDVNNAVVAGEIAVSTAGGNILINGTNFVANSNVYINNSLATNTLISSTQVRAICPANAAGNVSLYIFYPNGVGVLSGNSVRYSGVPSWTTTSAVIQNGVASNVQLIASSDSTLTFTLQGGSVMPTNVSVNSAGYITGTPTGYVQNTIFNPTIVATDAEGQATQQTITLTVQVSEPNFLYNSLLTKTTGNNAANNSVVIDSSSNAFTVTANGPPYQGTFSPYSQTGWSWYFNSGASGTTGDGVRLGTIGAVNTGSYTIECWVYPVVLDSTVRYFVWEGGGGGISLTGLAGNKTANVEVWAGGAFAGPSFTSTLTVSTFAWSHIAMVRNGTSVKVYVNGVADAGTATDNTAWTNGYFYIGTYNATTSNYYGGYISNLRFVVGTALYTSNFTPPTAALTSVAGTRILTCNTNRFSDSSGNSYSTVVTAGGPSVLARSPFAPTSIWLAGTYGGSGYYNGTTAYLTVPDNANLEPLANNFTIEGWIYPTSNVAVQSVVNKVANSAVVGSYGISLNPDGTLQLGLATTSGSTWASNVATATARSPIYFNAWNHIAWVRNTGGVFNCYINGNAAIAQYTTNITLVNEATTTNFGAYGNGSAKFSGYMSDFRILIGTALYSANFAPPTGTLTTISNTALLTNYTNMNIYDAHSGIDLITIGDAKSSTAQTKFANASIALDGTGDYLLGANITTTAINGAQFTVDGWLYYNIVSGPQYIVDTRLTNTSTTGIAISSNTNGYLTVTMNNVTVVTSNTAFVANTWTFFAVTRSSTNVVACWINGSNVGGAVNATSLSDTGLVIGTSIANRDATSTNHFNGYIEDLRITNGVARYSANFTPPTIPAQAQ